jgi:hypothetical protein
LLLVHGGGVEPPPSICITAVKIFFPCVELRHRAVPPALAGELLSEPEVDDARAPLDLDPAATYRFGCFK